MSWLNRSPAAPNAWEACSTGCGRMTRPDRCGAPALCPVCTASILAAVAAESRPIGSPVAPALDQYRRAA